MQLFCARTSFSKISKRNILYPYKEPFQRNIFLLHTLPFSVFTFLYRHFCWFWLLVLLFKIKYIAYYPTNTRIRLKHQIKPLTLHPEHNKVFTSETSMFDIGNKINDESYQISRVKKLPAPGALPYWQQCQTACNTKLTA